MSAHVATEIVEVKYEGKIDLSVKNNSHTMAFDLISNDSCGRKCKILEVGCSTGYFGYALKNVGHEVWGIEMSSVAAEKAKTVLDNVYVGTIEAFLAEALVQNIKFDYVTFGDVLEHLPNPSNVLQACKSILADNGAIVASIPNVAHIAVRLMLLEGRWEYSNLGIMDNTHLRFFTKNSIIHMFNNSGYFIKTIDQVQIPIEATGINVDSDLRKHVEPLMKDDEQDVFQYVLFAKKASNTQDAISKTQWHLNKSIKMLCLLPDISSPLAKIRLLDPLRTWAANCDGLIRIRNIGEFQDKDAAWADIVVLQREANPYVLFLISYFKSINKKIIFDLDDLLIEVPQFLTGHKRHKQTSKLLKKVLKSSDVVTVTNERLRNELIIFNQKISIIPNCSAPVLNTNWDKHIHGPIDLVIASSDTIQVDFIIPVLIKLLGQTEVKFNLIGIGAPGKFIANAGLPITLHENMSHDAFKAFIGSLQNSIGLIPLDDSKFSSCKSAIKFIDYSLCGVVSVCSSVPPYSDIVINNKTGLLVHNNYDSWYDAIMKLALNSDLRKSLTKEACKFCAENYNLESAAKLWRELINSLQISKQKSNAHSFSEYKKKNRLKLLYVYIFESSTYDIAMRIFKRDGFIGLLKKIKRIV